MHPGHRGHKPIGHHGARDLRDGLSIRRQLGAKAEAAFFRAVAAGEVKVELVTPAGARRIADLIETYSDLRLSGTDASVIVLAERLEVTTIATLDRRHFDVVRPNHVAAFDLIP